MSKLSTAEKFLILAHHPEKGRFRISEVHLKYGLIGALLLELAAQGSLQLEDGKVILRKKESHSRSVPEMIYQKISEHPSPRKVRFWIRKLAVKSNLYKWELMRDLEEKRIIRIEHAKILGLVPFKRSYLLGKKLQYDLIRETRNSVMQHGTIMPEDLVILGLVQACRMQKIISQERSERRIINKRLTAALKESPIAQEVDLTIRQVQTAIIAAVAASGVATTAATR
jgi:hypothetical protein